MDKKGLFVTVASIGAYAAEGVPSTCKVPSAGVHVDAVLTHSPRSLRTTSETASRRIQLADERHRQIQE